MVYGFFQGVFSLCDSPGCRGTSSVDKAGLELTEIHLSLPLLPSAGSKRVCQHCWAMMYDINALLNLVDKHFIQEFFTCSYQCNELTHTGLEFTVAQDGLKFATVLLPQPAERWYFSIN